MALIRFPSRVLVIAAASAVSTAGMGNGALAAATVDITGQNGWGGIPPVASPVLVTNEKSYSGTNSLYYDVASVDANPSFGGAFNAAFTPLTAGTVTLSFKVLSPAGSNADFGIGFDSGTDGGNSDPYPTQYAYGFLYNTNTGDDWATVQLKVDLDQAGTPYSTTVTSNGSTLTYDSYNLGGDQYSPANESPLVSELQIFIGRGVNGNASGPFYFDDVALTQTLGGVTSTVLADNFDSYVVPAVPEPASLGLLGLGAIALSARRRRA